MSRPEDKLPAPLFYNSAESAKYTTSSRIQTIQAEMTHRALSLLSLKTPSHILDIGCGSGLSGSIISSTPIDQGGAEGGGGQHIWTGMDISADMLGVALQRDVEGDLLLADVGQGLPFRAGAFDAAVSISALQWLCQAESRTLDDDDDDRRGGVTGAEGRLSRFFGGLYACLRRGARAVCQFYPKDERQRGMVCQAAIRAGFGAGLLVDGEGTKKQKVYLVLSVGGGAIEEVVEGLEGVDVQERSGKGREKVLGGRKGGKAWIKGRKEAMERRGKVVKPNSKYTGRKRRVQF